MNATPCDRSPPSGPATHPRRSGSANCEVDARRRWLEARQRVVDLEAALQSETADLQTRIWDALAPRALPGAARRRGRPSGRRAPGPAPATGSRRRRRADRVRRPLAPRRTRPGHRPRRARRPGDVAARAPCRRPHQRLRQPHGRRHPPRRRPDPRERTRAPMPPTSGPNGRAPTSTRPCTRSCAPTAARRTPATPANDSPSSWTNWQISTSSLRTATARVEALHREPAVRAPRPAVVGGERERWAADRLARQEAATREATQRRQRQQETPRIEPTRPSRSTPDHGRGIGR